MIEHSEDLHYSGPNFAPAPGQTFTDATFHHLSIRADGRAMATVFTRAGHLMTPVSVETFRLDTPITIGSALELLYRAGGGENARVSVNQVFGIELDWETA